MVKPPTLLPSPLTDPLFLYRLVPAVVLPDAALPFDTPWRQGAMATECPTTAVTPLPERQVASLPALPRAAYHSAIHSNANLWLQTSLGEHRLLRHPAPLTQEEEVLIGPSPTWPSLTPGPADLLIGSSSRIPRIK